MDLTDNETTALTLDIGWSFSPVGEDEELTKAIKSPGVCPEVQLAWDDMRQARTALRAASHAKVACLLSFQKLTRSFVDSTVALYIHYLHDLLDSTVAVRFIRYTILS
jgi:hypothetical protein